MIGENCDNCGNAGNGETYIPPNALDDDIAAELHSNQADFFGSVTPTFQLPDPPDRTTTDQELTALRQLKLNRLAMMGEINAEKDHFEWIFVNVLGIGGAPQNATYSTMLLLTSIISVTNFWAVRIKMKYNRPRPVQLAPDLDPPFCPGHPSYPSAHSCGANACASMLVEATESFPQFHNALHQAAKDIASHREVAGVHYRSDSDCGAVFADQLMVALRNDPAHLYLTSVAKVRMELSLILGSRG